MSPENFILCRAEFLLPLAAPDRTVRIADGYVLTEGAKIAEAGPWTPETAKRIREKCGSSLRVIGVTDFKSEEAAAEAAFPPVAAAPPPRHPGADGACPPLTAIRIEELAQ